MDRRKLSFAQAEGVEPLPSQLALKEISPELSATLWAVVYDSLNDCIRPHQMIGGRYVLLYPWEAILKAWWVVRRHKNIDEFPNAIAIRDVVKSIMTSKQYVAVFDFLQFVVRRPEAPLELENEIATMFERAHASYRMIDGTIMPITSDEQAQSIATAIATARAANAQGPYAHLRNASQALSAGRWAETVRESIHAVEAAATSIEPSAVTLGPALNKLQSSISLNPAMKKAFGALYGYTSDEKGVRHALIFNGQANVEERDAMFMFGACASFVGYLLSAKLSALNG